MTPPGKMREVKQNIDAFGQHLFQVFGDAESDAFAYTVGNAEQGGVALTGCLHRLAIGL